MLVRHRNVLNRVERLEKLKEEEKWAEGKSVFGLPKVEHRKQEIVKAAKEAARPKAKPPRPLVPPPPLAQPLRPPAPRVPPRLLRPLARRPLPRPPRPSQEVIAPAACMHCRQYAGMRHEGRTLPSCLVLSIRRSISKDMLCAVSTTSSPSVPMALTPRASARSSTWPPR